MTTLAIVGILAGAVSVLFFLLKKERGRRIFTEKERDGYRAATEALTKTIKATNDYYKKKGKINKGTKELVEKLREAKNESEILDCVNSAVDGWMSDKKNNKPN